MGRETGLMVSPSAGGVVILIKVVPGASRDRVMGVLGDALKLAVSKPASGGQANRAVEATLARFFGVPERAVTIESGQTNPRKRVRVAGISEAQARRIVAAGGGG